MSRVLKTALSVMALSAFATTASANCGAGLYCNSGATGAYGNGFSTTMQPIGATAPATIYSSASSASYQSFSGSTSSVAGLGMNESLQATNCPVGVSGLSEGSRVLGCYNVVTPVAQPVARTTYYRVVRPVVYVRYPVSVPVAVPVYGHGAGISPCQASARYRSGYNAGYSRYGTGYGYASGHRHAQGYHYESGRSCR